MRGFPPTQIFILALLFGLLAVPLVQLTGNAPSMAHADHDARDSQVVKGGTDHPEGEHKHVKVPAMIRLRYAHKPLSISLKSEGHELLAQVDLSSAPIEAKAEVEISRRWQ